MDKAEQAKLLEKTFRELGIQAVGSGGGYNWSTSPEVVVTEDGVHCSRDSEYQKSERVQNVLDDGVSEVRLGH